MLLTVTAIKLHGPTVFLDSAGCCPWLAFYSLIGQLTSTGLENLSLPVAVHSTNKYIQTYIQLDEDLCCSCSRLNSCLVNVNRYLQCLL